MSWKKHFTPVSADANSGSYSPLGSGGRAGPARTNYSSYLPDVYAGTPNRVERYMQYDTMDMDSEVNAALDILAEFCTQTINDNNTPFKIFYKQKATTTEIKLIKDYLQKWTKLQNFETRIFRIMRNVFKYGDSFFIRDPETQKWLYVDPGKVVKVIVNESEGKVPEQYVVRDINLNFIDLVATTPRQTSNNAPSGTAGYQNGGAQGRGMVGNAPAQSGTRFSTGQNEYAINSEHMIHLSLSEGLDGNYPFGTSLLESVFKVYKQKELLEDAIIIYRVQRAPERRVFYVDVGNMPAHMAMAFVERVKNEIWQRRVPSQSGGGASMVDASYNPLSMNEDYFFPQTAEGRGSKVDTLPGGTNLGEIDDLRYFTNKLFRALRIPSSYLPTGPDDGSMAINDGKVGTAFIQELRFNKYCERLQNTIAETFDLEFKLFLENSGINIDPSIFQLEFNTPQNFAAYRQAEMDGARVQTFAAIQEVPYMSKRFALKRFLGLSEEEIKENELMWRQENVDKVKSDEDAAAAMRSVGVTPGAVQGEIAGQDAEAEMEAPPADTGEVAATDAAATQAQPTPVA